MTLSPVDNWHSAKPRPDLPEYEINTIDANPWSGLPATENHHLFRRSIGRGFRDAWWVELEDGTVVPNRVGLSADSHRRVTENRVRILWEDGVFYWVTDSTKAPLDPQPGPQGAAPERAAVVARTDGGSAVPHEHDAEEECPRCHGKGKVRPKPKASVEGEKKPKQVLSVRIPDREQPDGHQNLSDLIEVATDDLMKAELLQFKTGSTYYVVHYALTFFLQNFNPARVETD